MDDYRNAETTGSQLVNAGGVSTTFSPDAMTPEALISKLKALVLDGPQCDIATLLAFADSARVSHEDLADTFIPAVARDLGEAWCSDQLGFAEVTIGTARLQALLRDLSKTWIADVALAPDASTVLLLVPDGAHHTLGAMVLAGQLRRLGLSVRMSLWTTPAQVGQICEDSAFDAVFISASRGQGLESLRQIVETVKNAENRVPPVVVGGSLLETDHDVIALTGADYVANTADEAVALCNLRTTRHRTQVMDN